MTKQEFEELTREVIQAEKYGFWSDWTKEQQDLFQSGDWKAFSRSRGYTEHEISRCDQWLTEIELAKNRGENILSDVKHLIDAAAQKNLSMDKNCEILKSSGPMGMPINVMEGLEKQMSEVPGALQAKNGDFPVKETFTDKQYIRESTIPKGFMFTTQIHKTEHPMILMKGDITVITENNSMRIKAPWYGVTKPGCKRVIFTHEDSTCVTIHATTETDSKLLEKELVCSTQDAYIEYTNEQKLLSKEK